MKALIEQHQTAYYRSAARKRPARRSPSRLAHRSAKLHVLWTRYNETLRGRSDFCRPACQTAGATSRPEPDLDARFRTLVQSPLRAGILRFLSARPEEAFDIEALMQTFGRMRLDVDNCVRELVEFGVVRRIAGRSVQVPRRPPRPGSRWRGCSTTSSSAARTVGIEDTSPSVQRFREMIGRDEKMLAIFEWIRTSAKSDISVLILGPTGSGKELVARMIHELSRRGTESASRPSTARRCPTRCSNRRSSATKRARSPAPTIASPGASSWPTAARCSSTKSATCRSSRRPSCCACSKSAASSGWAATSRSQVDFRLISATNRPLDLFVRESRFREDLYYRINAFSIRLPSLKERAVDIPVLANRFLARYCAVERPAARRQAVLARGAGPAGHLPLAGQHPRARKHGVARGALGARPRHPRSRHRVPARTRRRGRKKSRATVCPSLRDAERAHIIRVLEAVDWNKLEAAQVLDISRGTLYRKIEEYGLEPAAASARRRRAARLLPLSRSSTDTAAFAVTSIGRLFQLGFQPGTPCDTMVRSAWRHRPRADDANYVLYMTRT